MSVYINKWPQRLSRVGKDTECFRYKTWQADRKKKKMERNKETEFMSCYRWIKNVHCHSGVDIGM